LVPAVPAGPATPEAPAQSSVFQKPSPFISSAGSLTPFAFKSQQLIPLFPVAPVAPVLEEEVHMFCQVEVAATQ
jgi:hypothetical protein